MTNFHTTLAVACLAAFASTANADVVTDWNIVAGQLVVDSKLGTPPANRAMAIVQTAVNEAVMTVGAQQRGEAPPAATAAAVAAANRATLAKLIPAQQAGIAAAYQAALAKLADGPAKDAGIAAGEQAAATVLAARADDGAAAPERYRPQTAPGVYVPTAAVAAAQWPQRKPWLLASASQFRPGPPPALGSAQWARDYEEVMALGGKASTRRTAEQTEVARFWEYSLPPIYHALLRSVAAAPDRSVAQNARLYATATQAMDDAMIAVFDAKYHHQFWRPVTAIRNGDADGNDATRPDAGWTSMIESPLHPEYPSAHAILVATLGTVLQAEVPRGAAMTLSTSSPTAQGATRHWTRVDELMREVANARVWEGVHYRSSGEVGLAMGRQIGALAVATMSAQAPAVPPALVLPGDATLVDRVAARGVQVYECRAEAAASAGAAWVFVEPQAELFDAQGASRGTHYAGPHWEASDGSKIVGQVHARADAPQADAIPWLLLSTRSVGGAGRYAAVTRVQRVNTRGGLAPERACNASVLGSVERVPYTADYLLYAS